MAVVLQTKPELPVVVAETALPIKFADTMQRYLGVQPVFSVSQREMMAAKEWYSIIDPNADIVKEHIARRSREIAA